MRRCIQQGSFAALLLLVSLPAAALAARHVVSTLPEERTEPVLIPADVVARIPRLARLQEMRERGRTHYGVRGMAKSGNTNGYELKVLPCPEDAQCSTVGIDNRGRALVTINYFDGLDFLSARTYLWSGDELRDLGSLGGNIVYGYVMNHSGQIAGVANTADDEMHGFLWDDGNMTVLQDFDNSPAYPADLNDRGEIVGVGVDANFEQVGFHWRDGHRTTLSGFWSNAINNHGLIGGSGPGTQGFDVPKIWDDGVVTTLSEEHGGAFAVNDHGEVLGVHINSDQLFLWKDGTLTALEVDWALGAAYLNKRGQIASTWTEGDPTFIRRPFLWENGQWISIDIEGVFISAMNERGAIVGDMVSDHPFIWKDGITTYLDHSGHFYAWTVDVNDFGQVAGMVQTSGHASAAIWSPVPTPRSRDFEDPFVAINATPSDGVRFALRGELSGPVRVTIHDVSGRVIHSFDHSLEAGAREVAWDGHDEVPAGVYFARVTDAQGRQATGKAAVLR